MGRGIGYTGKGKLIWAVFAPTSTYALARLKVNMAAPARRPMSASSRRQCPARRPGQVDRASACHVEGSTGLNVAAGIGSISLKHVR